MEMEGPKLRKHKENGATGAADDVLRDGVRRRRRSDEDDDAGVGRRRRRRKRFGHGGAGVSRRQPQGLHRLLDEHPRRQRHIHHVHHVHHIQEIDSDKETKPI